MGFGSTAKKVQQMVDIAEKLHARVMDIKERVEGTQETVDDTAKRVKGIESELAEQRELLDALAAEQGIELEFDGGDGEENRVGDDDPGGDDNA